MLSKLEQLLDLYIPIEYTTTNISLNFVSVFQHLSCSFLDFTIGFAHSMDMMSFDSDESVVWLVAATSAVDWSIVVFELISWTGFWVFHSFSPEGWWGEPLLSCSDLKTWYAQIWRSWFCPFDGHLNQNQSHLILFWSCCSSLEGCWSSCYRACLSTLCSISFDFLSHLQASTR